MMIDRAGLAERRLIDASAQMSADTTAGQNSE